MLKAEAESTAESTPAPNGEVVAWSRRPVGASNEDWRRYQDELLKLPFVRVVDDDIQLWSVASTRHERSDFVIGEALAVAWLRHLVWKKENNLLGYTTGEVLQDMIAPRQFEGPAIGFVATLMQFLQGHVNMATVDKFEDFLSKRQRDEAVQAMLNERAIEDVRVAYRRRKAVRARSKAKRR
ncbi:MAG TPA: hypothetical protein VMQ73_18805 [Methylomirabilota bacterium]|nr:hypothetical protein [Methylomirabilota bacterium]